MLFRSAILAEIESRRAAIIAATAALFTVASANAQQARWNLPSDYPLVAPNYADKRRDLAERDAKRQMERALKARSR